MKLTNKLVVLDLETTGVWVDKDKIIEIGMIKVFPNGEEDRFHQRINPTIKIPQAVTELTGISNEDVCLEPIFKDVAKDILTFIDDSDLGGFNLERFDLPLLTRELNEAGRDFDWKKRTVYDAQKIYHINEKRDLTAAYKFYCQKDLTQAHSAMMDTQATLEVLMGQVDRYGSEDSSIECLKEFDYTRRQDLNYDSEGKFRWWNGELFMMFGKYAKKYSLPDVVQKDPKYLEWILSANFSEEIKVLVEEALKGKFPKPPLE